LPRTSEQTQPPPTAPPSPSISVVRCCYTPDAGSVEEREETPLSPAVAAARRNASASPIFLAATIFWIAPLPCSLQRCLPAHYAAAVQHDASTPSYLIGDCPNHRGVIHLPSAQCFRDSSYRRPANTERQ
uniref:Uncharacterized protein n=1 Tax=Aegilops tauschii subsp. strangulata TaxID=200361 RepID=A0A453K1I4_AEGTS